MNILRIWEKSTRDEVNLRMRKRRREMGKESKRVKLSACFSSMGQRNDLAKEKREGRETLERTHQNSNHS